jgi:arginyl-tRNA synthetase
VKINPLPSKFGVGFVSNEPVNAPGFNYQQVGIYHNYTVTPAGYHWPVEPIKANVVLDGFSPNLNKFLHCGHLKNLAVASALAKITGAKAVAMLGAANGVLAGALDSYKSWCQLAQYNPAVYFDTQLPKPSAPLQPGTGEKAGTMVFIGPKGEETVVVKSDGKSTYASHDLAFAEVVGPTHYVVGAEQKEHFQALGLGDKHKPLGLLAGADGKKMSSSSGEAVTAAELFAKVLSVLKPTDEPEKLAWNILAFQLNSGSVSGTTKFNPEQWAKPESPGMYVTYTLAKMTSALDGAGEGDASQIDQQDAEILGTAAQLTHYWNKAIAEMEPVHVTTFALLMAKKLANVYGKQTIKGGKPGFVYACKVGTAALAKALELLAMYPLTTV